MKKWLYGFLVTILGTFLMAHGEHPTLKVAAPPEGLLVLPILRMQEVSPNFDAAGIEIEAIPWKNQEQLRAVILKDQAQVVMMHTVGAANFFNRGKQMKLLGVSISNVLHVLSTDSKIKDLDSLAGKKIAVPFKGELPDILFRTALKHSGKLKSKIKIQYASTSQDAANLLLAGKVDAALVAEPHCSQLEEKWKQTDSEKNMKLYRVLALEEFLCDQLDGLDNIPSAGPVAIGDFATNIELQKMFWEDFKQAVEWCIAHPEDAIALKDKDHSRSKAYHKGMKNSLKQTYLKPVDGKTVLKDTEQLFNILLSDQPKMLNGKLPMHSFYFGHQEAKEKVDAHRKDMMDVEK